MNNQLSIDAAAQVLLMCGADLVPMHPSYESKDLVDQMVYMLTFGDDPVVPLDLLDTSVFPETLRVRMVEMLEWAKKRQS